MRAQIYYTGVPADRSARCEVTLGCWARPSYVAVIGQPGGRESTEVALCTEHANQLAGELAGEPACA